MRKKSWLCLNIFSKQDNDLTFWLHTGGLNLSSASRMPTANDDFGLKGRNFTTTRTDSHYWGRKR